MTQHIRTPEQLDPQIGIAAARQASNRRLDLRYERPTRQLHHPRKLLGFDLIKGLHDISNSRLGQKYAYNYCAVQKDRHGNISAELDFDQMRLAQSKDEITYTQLVQYAVNEAEQIAMRLGRMDPEMRLSTLSRLVKEAQRDGRIAWVLSAACLRRYLFPASYADKRIDDVWYLYKETDSVCGKSVVLDGLQPGRVKRFLTHAALMCPTIDPKTITPITNPHND